MSITLKPGENVEVLATPGETLTVGKNKPTGATRVRVTSSNNHPTPPPDPTPIPPPSGAYPPDSTLKIIPMATATMPQALVPWAELPGTRSVRISPLGHTNAYSRLSAHNSDDSVVFLGAKYPGILVDAKTFAPIKAGSDFMYSQLSGPVWSNKYPDRMYGTDAENDGARLWVQNPFTETRVEVFNFATLGYHHVSIGEGEGGIDDNDHFLALFGYRSGSTDTIVFDLERREVHARTAMGGNNVQISHSGAFVVLVGNGTRVYNRDLTNGRELFPQGNHGDNCLNAAGEDIYVGNSTANGVESFRLSDLKRINLLPAFGVQTAFNPGHTCGRANKWPGHVILSSYDPTFYGGGARPGKNQVIALNTDGSGVVKVYALDHHTRMDYSTEPHATVSHDGRTVVWSGEFGGTSVAAFASGAHI